MKSMEKTGRQIQKNQSGIMDQGIAGVRIPSYIEEILTHNYCPFFMRMSMIRENDVYRFIYRPANLRKINFGEMDIYSKLLLLRNLIEICSKTSGYLIRPERYLLEPELIYTAGDGFCPEDLRIMFYPDSKELDEAHKIMLFAERIRGNSRDEREFFDQFRRVIETGNTNRAGLLLEKNIMRLEGRMSARTLQ